MIWATILILDCQKNRKDESGGRDSNFKTQSQLKHRQVDWWDFAACHSSLSSNIIRSIEERILERGLGYPDQYEHVLTL